jgi:hypothetical protein
MYGGDEDVYGDELDGDEDRNDGLNALVTPFTVELLESTMGHWYQQGD